MIKICKNSQEVSDFIYQDNPENSSFGYSPPSEFPVLVSKTFIPKLTFWDNKLQQATIVNIGFIYPQEMQSFIQAAFKADFKDVVEK